MILFEDGRSFQIAGTTLSDGTTIIPFSAIRLGDRPDSFPIEVTGVTPPILYVRLTIDNAPPILAAMSTMEYNQLAIAEAHRLNKTQQRGPLQRLAGAVVARTGCRACGRR